MRIVCPIHGEFTTKPTWHINGKQGCPECGLEIARNVKRWTKEEFVYRANSVHNNKYDYSKVEYINSLTKVCIICPEHGEFWQQPYSHVKGFGCSKCGDELRGRNQTKTLEEFIDKGNKVHNGKYDYSKSEYVNYETPLIITCPKHGDFLQTPHDHLDGCGCQKCAVKISKPEIEIVQYLELFNNKITAHERNIIAPYEVDIYMP